MQAYYGNRLSEHISKTPEGYLVCHSVPVCRTAVRVPQQYRGSELGVADDAVYDLYRAPREVLAPRFLASLEGKPVTSPHPPQFLNPENVAWYAKGHIQNVRPGPRLPDGEQAVVADLVITDPNLIEEIKTGRLREVSTGYVYDLDEQDGVLQQRNLSANHVAVVQDGRAGKHIRINDAALLEGFAAVCSRFHRQANPRAVVTRHAAEDAIPYDNRGTPRSWDELGKELSETLNHKKTREAAAAGALVSADEEDFEALCARYHRQNFVRGK